MNNLKVSILFGIFLFSVAVFANSSQPVKKTQEALTDKNKRSELLKDPKAQKANDAALGVVGSEANLDEAYSIASELLPVLIEMNGNDPEAAAKSLEAFQKDPEKFMKALPQKSQDRIRALAEKVQAESKKKP